MCAAQKDGFKIANSVSLQFLFLEPNASDPLNKDAAEDIKTNRDGFKRNVRMSMARGSVRNVPFDRVLK